MRPGSVVRLAALALLWGSSFLWIKMALRGLSPVQITLARLALGAVVLLALLVPHRTGIPRDRRAWAHLTVAALFANALPYTLFGIGEQHVDSNIAGVLNATTPLWTVVIAFVVRHERGLSALRLGGLALGLVGTLLIFAPWRTGTKMSMAGALACLAAAASYGVSYVYMARFLAGRGVSPLALSACQLVAATGLLAAVTPLAGLHGLHLRADVIASVAVLGTLGTGVAYVLNYRLITDEGAVVASTVTYLLPIVSVSLGAAVLSETISGRVVVGMALVLVGVALAQRGARSEAEPEASKASTSKSRRKS